MYVGGGLTPRLLPMLKDALTSSFLTDKVMGDVIRSFPLYAVLDDNVGLLGARVRAFRIIKE